MHTHRGIVLLALLGAVGCGAGGPAMHSTEGQVQVAAGDVRNLAGSTVEAALDSDPTVRSSGTITEDGRFVLETLHSGQVRKGAQEGTYRARVILNEDDPQSRKRAAQVVAAKYLDFKTAGLSFKVPATEPVLLKVSRR